MSLERDVRIRVHALLEAGKTSTEISKQLDISRPTVHKVKATGMRGRSDGEEVKQILMADPLKSIRAHAADYIEILRTKFIPWECGAPPYGVGHAG
ncbi:Uncharacterized protein FKW44_018042, partial [Caligus rogercresseyi]